MSQTILPPDDEWLNYIAQLWVLGSQISQAAGGGEMDGSLGDLDRVQAVLDTGELTAEDSQALHALGAVFGRAFIQATPDYDWWVVEDEFGKDACIRYKETSLMIFPLTMISKRVEDGEEVDVRELFDGLREMLVKVRKEHDPE